MAPRSFKEKRSTLPGLWKYPTNRDASLKSDTGWLAGKRMDDGAESLWRVHDTLYDLSPFIYSHPGGAEWLQLTKGTDITEAFECHHISSVPRKILQKYKVRDANTQRNSPYTFIPDGFYATLRKRVVEKVPDILQHHGPSPQSCRVVDTLMTLTLLTGLASSIYQNYALAALSGTILGFGSVATHNFIHLRENWRKGFIRFLLFSTRRCRTIHVLSHHVNPNSVQDLEISLFEPYFNWLVLDDKGSLSYLSWVITPFLYMVAVPVDFIRTVMTYGLGWQELTPFIVPLALYAANPSAPLTVTLTLWAILMLASSFWFQAIGLNAGHHHPDVFHDGDAARVDRDWGLAMVDSVRDRTIISGVTGSHTKDKDGKLKVHIDFKPSLLQHVLTLTNYGHHVLHHLFPTLDHYYLPKLYPVLEETLQEFGEVYRTTTVREQIKGQFQQLVRTQPNPVPPGSYI